MNTESNKNRTDLKKSDERKNRERNRTNRKENGYRIMNMKQQASVIPARFRYYKDSVMRVAGRDIVGSYYVLKEHSASSQGGSS